jgi:hypothetical protein
MVFKDTAAAGLLPRYEARIAALDRFAGKQALELEFPGGCERRTAAEKRDYVRRCRPPGLSVAEGCRPMGIARSTFYDKPAAQDDLRDLRGIRIL